MRRESAEHAGEVFHPGWRRDSVEAMRWLGQAEAMYPEAIAELRMDLAELDEIEDRIEQLWARHGKLLEAAWRDIENGALRPDQHTASRALLRDRKAR